MNGSRPSHIDSVVSPSEGGNDKTLPLKPCAETTLVCISVQVEDNEATQTGREEAQTKTQNRQEDGA